MTKQAEFIPYDIYPYDIVNEQQNIGLYTGVVMTITSPLVEPPPHSRFKPPAVTGTAADVYFDGTGWVVGPKYDAITDAMVKDGILKQLRNEFLATNKEVYLGWDVVDKETFPTQVNLARDYVRGQTDNEFIKEMAFITFGNGSHPNCLKVAEHILTTDRNIQKKQAEMLVTYKKKVSTVTTDGVSRIWRSMLFAH